MLWGSVVMEHRSRALVAGPRSGVPRSRPTPTRSSRVQGLEGASEGAGRFRAPGHTDLQDSSRDPASELGHRGLAVPVAVVQLGVALGDQDLADFGVVAGSAVGGGELLVGLRGVLVGGVTEQVEPPPRRRWPGKIVVLQAVECPPPPRMPGVLDHRAGNAQTGIVGSERRAPLRDAHGYPSSWEVMAG